MENIDRYNKLSTFFKNKFGEKTLKICVDGGFTCPNRDGTLGYGGCIFCSEQGSGELIKGNLGISNQVREYLSSYKAKKFNKYIVYFQNFTNTYDTVDNLKNKYDSALIDDKIVGLAIGTRPDCINDDIVKLIKSYTNKYYVWVELGLQSSNDKTGNFINRGYTSSQFTNAVELLNKYNIDVVVHIMIGLPNENRVDLLNTVKFINNHRISGIKIHSTYIVKNTKLANMYFNGEYSALELDDYLESLVDVITNLRPDIVVHRIFGDAPKYILVAPKWNLEKMRIMNRFDKIMNLRNLTQGIYYKK